jgi:hypothetical protein
MKLAKRITSLSVIGFLTAFPLSIFIPSSSHAVSGSITQDITSLECAITTTNNGLTQPTISLDESCKPLQGNPTTPTTQPSVTIIENENKETIQLPYIRSSGYAVVTNTDGVSTIKIPFEPITSSENTLSPNEATQAIPGAVFVMGFSTIILVAVVVLL